MEITQNSVIVQKWNNFWCAFLTFYWASVCGAVCTCLGRKIHKSVTGSRVCSVIWREGVLSRSWQYSFFCEIGDWIVNLIPNILKCVYARVKNVLDNSAVFQALNFAGDKLYALVGLFFLVMLITPHDYWNNIYGLLGVVVLTGIFMIGLMRHRQARVQLRYFSVYLAFYAILVVYGFVFSESRALSLRFFLFHMTCLLIVFLIVSSISNYGQLKYLVGLMLVGLTISALYGCYQGVAGVEVIASQADMTLNEGMPGRIYSFFDNPNNFAEILIMLIPFYFAFFLNANSVRSKLIVLAAALPPLAALALTYSRSGWIGLALAVMIFLAFQNWRFIPLCIVLGIAAIPFLPQTILNRIMTIGNTKDTSTMYRFAIFEAIVRLLKDVWATGAGLGSDVVGQMLKNYPMMFDGNYPIHSHNNYLQMWSEVGILGIVGYLAVLLYQLKAGVKRVCSRTCPRELKNFIAAGIASMCGIMVIGIAEYTWFYPRNMFVFWLLFAVVGAGIKLSGRDAAQQNETAQ